MTPTELQANQNDDGNLVSKLAGVSVGTYIAAGTVACTQHPTVAIYAILGAAMGGALAHDNVTVKNTSGCIGIGYAVTMVTGISTLLNGKSIENVVDGLAAGFGVALPLVAAAVTQSLHEKYDSKDARNRISKFTRSAFLTATLLISCYALGKNLDI